MVSLINLVAVRIEPSAIKVSAGLLEPFALGSFYLFFYLVKAKYLISLALSAWSLVF
jgi:hypothetical protein